MSHTPHPHDLVIGLDRSDQKADLCLIDTATGQHTPQTIDTCPEALQDWLAQLRQQYPQGRVGLVIEQPALNLLAFLEPIDWITPLRHQSHHPPEVSRGLRHQSRQGRRQGCLLPG